MNENENEKKLPLYIPTRVADDEDIISGIGVKEIVIIGCGAGIALVLAIIIIASGGGVVKGILIPFALVAVLVVCIRRDQCSESLVDKLKFVWVFSQAQKKYEYLYFDFLEDMIKRMEKENDSE